MSLDSSLFILVLIVLAAIFFLPIRFYIQAEHNEQWSGSVHVQILWFRIPLKKLHNTWTARTEHMMQRMHDDSPNESRFVQLYWRPIVSFGRQALHIVAERVQVEQLHLRCCIGWSRADYTAYSYGLFWILMSALPERWLQTGTFVYEPDFQRERQDILVQSIICCRIAQIMGILAALFVLTVRMILMQKRKEQIGYEAGLRRESDGNSDGEYQEYGRGEHHHR